MKTRTVLTVWCICIGGMSAGGVDRDSLVVAAALADPAAQTTAAAPGNPHAPHAGNRRSALGCMKTFYGKFISSQDGNTCTFSQSCSNFCVWAVQCKGLMQGFLLTADRLTRCNGIQPERYDIDSLSGKNIDDIPGLFK